MNEAISNILQVFCYLNDIIIMSKNLKEDRQTLRQVFARLRDHGLVVKALKMHRCCTKPFFLRLPRFLQPFFLLNQLHVAFPKVPSWVLSYSLFILTIYPTLY